MFMWALSAPLFSCPPARGSWVLSSGEHLCSPPHPCAQQLTWSGCPSDPMSCAAVGCLVVFDSLRWGDHGMWFEGNTSQAWFPTQQSYSLWEHNPPSAPQLCPSEADLFHSPMVVASETATFWLFSPKAPSEEWGIVIIRSYILSFLPLMSWTILKSFIYFFSQVVLISIKLSWNCSVSYSLKCYEF